MESTWWPTLGTFLRGFTFGHLRQLDRVLAEVLARAWSLMALPVGELLGQRGMASVCCARPQPFALDPDHRWPRGPGRCAAGSRPDRPNARDLDARPVGQPLGDPDPADAITLAVAVLVHPCSRHPARTPTRRHLTPTPRPAQPQTLPPIALPTRQSQEALVPRPRDRATATPSDASRVAAASPGIIRC